MLFPFIIVSFWILIVSLVIAFFSYYQYLRKDRHNSINFLFGHNTPFKATISNVGSILSLTTVIGIFITAIIGWGLLVIIALLGGVLLGYFLFYLAVQSIKKRNCLLEPLSDSATNTLLDLTDDSSKKILRVLQVLLYTSVLITEFSLARFILEELFPNSDALPLITLVLLVLLCATYTSIGGYIGVLRTDIFQILVLAFGTFSLLYLSRGRIGTILDSVWETKCFIGDTFPLGSILLCFALFCFIIAYSFSWPDLWIRNIGTLPRITRKQARSTIDFRPLLFGWFGILVVIFPCVLFAFNLLSQSVRQTQTFETTFIIRSLVIPLGDENHFSHYGLSLLLLFGGSVCVLITTIDTWLLGIVQHFSIRGSARFLPIIRLMPYCFSIIALFISIVFVSSWLVFYIFGLVVSLVLFANFGIVVGSAFLRYRPCSFKSYLLIYLLIGGGFTFYCIFRWHQRIMDNEYLAFIAVLQFLWSGILIVMFRKGARSRKEGQT